MPVDLGIRFTGAQATPLFLLRFRENGLLYNRYGFVISKKINKHAVARNRIKRLFSTALMLLEKEIKTGYDMLFIVKTDVSKQKLEKISGALKTMFNKEKMAI